MTGTDRATRYAAALAVLVVATIAAVISYGHAYELVRTHGEAGWTARALPLTVDGLIVTCSLVVVDSARRGERAPVTAWLLLGTGIVATLGANVAHGLAHGAVGAIVSGWPALVAVGSFEMLSRLIRGGRSAEAEVPTVEVAASGDASNTEAPARWQPWPVDERPVPAVPVADEVQVRAVEVFADDLAAGRVPGIRAIKEQLRVGQPKAKEVRAHLSVLVSQ